MRRLATDLHAAWQFLRTGLRQIDKTASLLPSSRFLVDAMVAGAPLETAKCVVEFGPGTGAITKAVLDRLPHDAHLHAIELDGELLQGMTKRLHDPRLRPHHGSAADAARLLAEAGCRHRVDVIISSLGFALMSDALRAEILSDTRELLSPDGVFVQYTYPTAKALTYQFEQGWSRFDGRAFLQRHFRQVESRTVLLNVPPAMVHVCRGMLSEPVPIQVARQRRRQLHRPRLRAVGRKR